MTYQNQGVAKVGVVKHHHSIIYTRIPAPLPTSSELPQRRPDGAPEEGMLPNSVRVAPRSQALALDPLARLNYGNPLAFDYGVRVETFGRVHDNSVQDFIFQFRYVWRNRQTTAESQSLRVSASPGPAHSTPPVSDQPAAESVNAPPLATSTAPAALGRGPPAQVAAGPGTSEVSHARSDSGIAGVAFQGPIGVEVVVDAIDKFKRSAATQELPAPPELTIDGLQTMAQNHEVRQQYFDAYKALWRQTLQARAPGNQHNSRAGS